MSLPTAAPNDNRASLGGSAVGPLPCIIVRAGIGHDVVALSGELDLYTAPQLRRVIHGLLAQGHNRLTLNLDEVTFIDWFTTQMLIAAHRHAARTGGSLGITHNRLCARLLTITGTTTTPSHPPQGS